METLNDFIGFLTNTSPDNDAANQTSREFNGIFSFLLGQQDKENSSGAQTHRSIDIYLKAVIACRKDDFATSERLLDEADTLLDTLPEEQILPRLFKLSAWANYYYKVGRCEEALALLKKGLYISAELERNGYPILIFRRIEQVQNMARIYHKMGDLESAADLLKSAIVFLYSGKAEGLVIEDWNSKLVQDVRMVQENALDSVFNQLAALNTTLMYDPKYNNEYFYTHYFKLFLAEMPTDVYNRVILYNWMFVKASYFNDDEATYFDNLKSFFGDNEVSSYYDSLKINLLEEVVTGINTDFKENDSAAIAKIQDYAGTYLKDAFGKPAKIAFARTIVLKAAV